MSSSDIDQLIGSIDDLNHKNNIISNNFDHQTHIYTQSNSKATLSNVLLDFNHNLNNEK